MPRTVLAGDAPGAARDARDARDVRSRMGAWPPLGHDAQPRRSVPADDGELRTRMRLLSEHVRGLVDERRSLDPDPDDPYRGLYVSDAEADTLADENGERLHSSRFTGCVPSAPPTAGSRLAWLASAFGLDEFDLDLLFIAVAVDLEPRFEKLFGYLHDDITRKRPSVGLALELTGRGFADSIARARLSAEAPLVKGGLVLVEEPARSFLARPLRVPDRVVGHLLGDDRMESRIDRLRVASVGVDGPDAERVATALATGVTPVYLQDGLAGVAVAVAASAFHSLGLDALCVELTGLGSGDDATAIAQAALREARLQWAGLVVAMPEEVADAHPDVPLVLAESDWPVVVTGPNPWDPAWSVRPVLSDVAPHADRAMTMPIWTSSLPHLPAEALHDATRQLRLRPDQILRAAQLALLNAASQARAVAIDDVVDAARAQNSSRLERLARRVRPAVDWSDLVLPDDVIELLREVEIRYKHRDEVHGDWGMGGKNNRRLGVISLFAGPSGVGKTMAAEALAGALGLDMYQVNLATVVDKYIGETEKNLERIFAAAEGVNGVILFDEADALFGKRSEVSDARDRYANVEVAYLLQRLETYEGVAVLATNLRTNIDEAFTRRLDVLVDFPEPDPEQRLILWDRCLGLKAPRADDVDLDFLSARFRLSGGNIRNISVAAAFLASADDRSVEMADLIRSTAQEYRKLGRLCTASEFGQWHEYISV